MQYRKHSVSDSVLQQKAYLGMLDSQYVKILYVQMCFIIKAYL